MGILSSLKKLLFVNKAIVESAADKTTDYVKEKSEDIMHKSEDFLKETSENIVKKSVGLKESMSESAESLVEKSKKLAGDAFEKAKDFGSDVADKAKEIRDDVAENEYVKKAADVSEKLGEQILDAGEDLVEKAKSFSEKVGEEVIDKGEVFMDKAKTTSEKVGEKVLAAKDDLVKKAKEITDDLGDKLDKTIEKAEKWQAEEDAKPKEEFAKEDLKVSEKSLLDGKDDFFSKASEYADGDYDAFDDGSPKIVNTEDLVEPLKKTGNAAGFDDLDGDGNEIIDDAIIEE